MGTEIKTWQIIDDKLTPIDTALKMEGRNEPYVLEPWLASTQEELNHNAVDGCQT